MSRFLCKQARLLSHTNRGAAVHQLLPVDKCDCISAIIAHSERSGLSYSDHCCSKAVVAPKIRKSAYLGFYWPLIGMRRKDRLPTTETPLYYRGMRFLSLQRVALPASSSGNEKSRLGTTPNGLSLRSGSRSVHHRLGNAPTFDFAINEGIFFIFGTDPSRVLFQTVCPERMRKPQSTTPATRPNKDCAHVYARHHSAY